MGSLIVTPYCVTMVGIIVAGFDRLCMRDLGHDVSRMVVECRNDLKQRCLGVSPGGRTQRTLPTELKKRRGDVASPVAATLPSNHFHAKEIRQS